MSGALKPFVEVQSPTRVDLCGGTLDLWPLYLLQGTAITINMAIPVFSRVVLQARQDQRVQIEVFEEQHEFENLKVFLESEHALLSLAQEVVRYFEPSVGFSLKMSSESPVGAGLGGSSSLMVGLLRAFSESLQVSLSDHDLVKVASDLEARVLKTPTGTQDYWPALKGGTLKLHYQPGPVEVTSQQAWGEWLSHRAFIVYTGRSHHSGLNNWDVLKKAIQDENQVRQTLADLAALSEKVLQALNEKKASDLVTHLKEETRLRLQLSPEFSSPEIEELNKFVAAHGGDTIKICGAGGGGCILVFASPEVLPDLRRQIEDSSPLEGDKQKQYQTFSLNQAQPKIAFK